MAIYISTPEILQRYRISKGTLKICGKGVPTPFLNQLLEVTEELLTYMGLKLLPLGRVEMDI